jgi:trehalose-6-phosphate synthase
MLITSLKDGLNLTAKEYVASQVRNSGVLLLSRSAGAWRELYEDAVGLNPNEPQSIVDSIALALAMGERERRERMRNMKRKLSANPLSNWVSRFTDEPASDSTDVIQLFSTCKGRTSS